jgi:hypothetical protein
MEGGIKVTGYTGKGGKVVIPSKIEDIPVIEIGTMAFTTMKSGNAPDIKDSITSIVIPNSIEVIGFKAFTELKNIKNIVVPNSVKSIDDNAFANMQELTKVTLPDGLKILSIGVFAECRKLNSINLPSELEEIHSVAFSYCAELNELIIPDTLTKIIFTDLYGRPNTNNGAFAYCQKLPIKTRQIIQELGYTGFF